MNGRGPCRWRGPLLVLAASPAVETAATTTRSLPSQAGLLAAAPLLRARDVYPWTRRTPVGTSPRRGPGGLSPCGHPTARRVERTGGSTGVESARAGGLRASL